ncbi:guanine nucleotide-releasing factor 2 [Anabrus simplex]|uniref:guanine nucleotide-releasing factor 2 n=1 Tax=Anabrus simplex TaxID=316456 RepID=UPI0035A2D9E8
MRSPGGGSSQRSGSPHSPKTRSSHKGSSIDAVDTTAEKNPLRDLDLHVKQVHLALKHFRDVVSKKKLEMLSGNGTVVLETVTTIHGVLKMYVLNEQSSTLVSATNQVYQSVAKLIKLCDDVLLQGDKALDRENVTEIVVLVEEAVQNLVSLAQDKIENRETALKANANHTNHYYPSLADRKSGYILSGVDLPQRSSLPDIPLTPRERQILEQTSTSVIDRPCHNSIPHSQSSESILNDASPPPKPPLPGRTHHMSESSDSPAGDPPPLPPKRRNRPHHLQTTLHGHAGDDSSLTDTLNSSSNTGLAASLDRISLRSKSPEDTSSLLSASAGSLDSVLNHSREEEEIQVLMDTSDDNVHISDNILNQGSSLLNGSSCCCWDSSSSTASTEPVQFISGADKVPSALHSVDPPRKSPLFSTDLPPIAPGSIIGFDTTVGKLDHLSSSQAESGFASMHSLRSSSQSYTASSISSQHFSSSVSRSSQQSSVSFSSAESNSSKTWQVHHKSSTTTTEASSTSQHLFSSSDLKSDSVSTSFMHHSESTLASSSTITLGSDSMISTGSGDDSFSLLDKDGPSSLSPVHDSSTGGPPALPQKTRSKKRRDRQVSQYDNVPSDDTDQQESHIVSCSLHQSESSSRSPENKPPPLPLKKKHIMAYMEMFGNCSHANTNEFLRHSVHTYNLLQAEWQQQEMSLTSTQSCSFSVVSSHSSQVFPPPAFPPMDSVEVPSPSPALKESVGLPPALPPKRNRTASVKSTTSPPPPSSPPPVLMSQELSVKENINHVCHEEEKKHRLEPKFSAAGDNSTAGVAKRSEITPDVIPESNPLEELDITVYLVYKKPDEEGPDVRGGHADALIIHATKANKNDFLYQEAFLTTYRTFLSPLELIRKLCHRHQRFSCSSDLTKQRAARESFSLLVRVVSDLTMSDLDNVVLQTLMDFVYQLLCSGDLTMAKALRVKILEKYNAKKLHNTSNTLLPSLNIYTRQASLLDFKSEQIAEQMTLLDANLFMKIEIPEVLIWAQEQNEERSPNLTRFTEHFNKMSYWARSRILEQSEAKDRERYVVKFIKIMKHLRKINNFNSYLALLSALDSAPIRRLEWQKQITEGLKEYCALIDSSSSFRAYRQALAETQPPCIPYIGLVLQDLTFVHIGNSDLLPEGSINFSKRWQQFNIVENMKRFKKGTYPYKKHERIIAFFNNFDDFLCEEAMWQISESIKPRGGKKPQT